MVQKAITIRRTGAIGDAIASTIVADKLAMLGYQIIFQTHPNCRDVVARCPFISRVTEPAGYADINLDGAYEKDHRKANTHFYLLLLDSACRQSSVHCSGLNYLKDDRPTLRVCHANAQAFTNARSNLDRPWTFICPRSEAYNVRQVPDWIWMETARALPGTKFWIGMHPAPPGIHDCNIRNIEVLVDAMSTADLLLSVDTGPTQIAAALRLPAVVIKQAVDPALRMPPDSFQTVSVDLDCLNCQKNICPKNQFQPPCQNVDPQKIASAALRVLVTRRS